MLDLSETSYEFPLNRVNQLLRESQHIRHLAVGSVLANFDGSEYSFSSNSGLRSLGIRNMKNGAISKSLLDGLAVNTGIQHLELSFEEDAPEQEGYRTPLEYFLTEVLPKCRSLQSLTVEVNFEDFTAKPSVCHLFREKVLQFLAAASLNSTGKHANRFGSLVCLRVITPMWWYQLEAPHEIYHRIVSPLLALSWWRQSRNGNSWSTSAMLPVPDGLIPSMVSAVNQHVICVKTTGVNQPVICITTTGQDRPCPFDSRNANATLIYDFVRSFRASFSMPTHGITNLTYGITG
jgi:hypothetical protein